MSTGRQLIEAYATWWKKWDWDWFGALTFPGYPGRNSAIRKFERWIDEIEREQGAGDFRYVRVIETGAYDDNIHIHILVGGLKRQARLFPAIGRERWEKIAGAAAITRFDPEKGGVYYLLKTLDPAREFDVDFRLPKDGREMEHSAAGKKPFLESARSKKWRKSMDVYEGVLPLKRTTTGTVVYGNPDLRGQYLPKELLRELINDKGEYPKELVFIIKTVTHPQNGGRAGSTAIMHKRRSVKDESE